ncbi:PP161 [Orf virus]|uniref:PP161 n=1 Tax=Orf virus TaxID=10258 RepID=F1AWY7_ORFV|nr:PP161 [Orf virus]
MCRAPESARLRGPQHTEPAKQGSTTPCIASSVTSNTAARMAASSSSFAGVAPVRDALRSADPPGAVCRAQNSHPQPGGSGGFESKLMSPPTCPCSVIRSARMLSVLPSMAAVAALEGSPVTCHPQTTLSILRLSSLGASEASIVRGNVALRRKSCSSFSSVAVLACRPLRHSSPRCHMSSSAVSSVGETRALGTRAALRISGSEARKLPRACRRMDADEDRIEGLWWKLVIVKRRVSGPTSSRDSSRFGSGSGSVVSVSALRVLGALLRALRVLRVLCVLKLRVLRVLCVLKLREQESAVSASS